MVSKYFALHELLPKELFETNSIDGWKLLDSRILITIDKLKEIFPNGTITINNYFWGGNRNWSGLRTPNSNYYSPTSQHTFGRAIDAKFSEYDEDYIRTYIIEHPKEFPHITGIEMGISWLHIDCRNEDTVKLFYP